MYFFVLFLHACFHMGSKDPHWRELSSHWIVFEWWIYNFHVPQFSGSDCSLKTIMVAVKYFSDLRESLLRLLTLIVMGGGLLWPRDFLSAYNAILAYKAIADIYWLLMYVLHRHFKKDLRDLAAPVFVWRPSKESQQFSSFWVRFLKGPQSQSFEARTISFWMGGPDI